MPLEFKNAEDALAQYFERVAAGEALDFDDYCRSWPQWSQEMRDLRDTIERFGSFVHRVGMHTGSGSGTPLPGGVELGPTLKGTLEQLTSGRPLSERYEVREEIGRGGMGVVHRAWDVVLKREVAMKRISFEGNASGTKRRAKFEPRSIGRFVEEAQITAQLDHPSIVPIHDFGRDEHGDLYFTMRLVEGRTLAEVFDFVRQGDPSWNTTRVVGVLLRVCEALAFAHSKGVVHRDLKPANVMVGEFGAVYVMDWGLARILDALHQPAEASNGSPARAARAVTSDRRADGGSGSGLLTQSGDVVGTPAYMSPEQGAGALEHLGPSADVYSVGAMLYTLLAGRPPFSHPGETPTPAQVLERLRVGPPASLGYASHDQPAELIAICDKAMARTVAARYASTLELAEELRAYLEGRVVRAHRSDLATVMRKWAARNRALSATIAVALAVVVGGATGFILMLQGEVAAKEKALVGQKASTRELDRVDHRLRADDLIARSTGLFPATPTRVQAMDEWLLEADALLTSRAEHVADAAVLAGGTEHALRLESLLEALSRLQLARDEIAERRERANSLERRSIADQHVQWSRAIEGVAESGLYSAEDEGKFRLEPQLGLMPLGENPLSGLWEFWVLDSGEAPREFDAARGAWKIGPQTAIVLVLVPGAHHESELLHPFFCGKYEVTQGQWARAMGSNHAELRGLWIDPATRIVRDFDEAHPAESMTWQEAWLFCQRLDLRLPRVTEWMHFASAGTNDARWTGDTLESLISKENVRYDPRGIQVDDGDEYPFHAPVGVFYANPMGAFDVLGNVGEWCQNAYRWTGPTEPAVDDLVSRARRGGDFQDELVNCSVAFAGSMRSDNRNFSTGLRVARSLSPCPWCETK